MGVTHADVEMLNNSMRYAGGAFRQSRLDAEQLKQQKIENELRERTLKAGQYRTDIEAAGRVSAYLSGDDGGVVQYDGPPAGLQQMIDAAAAKGKTLKQVSAPKTAPRIGSFKTTVGTGELTFYLNDLTEMQAINKLVEQIGGVQKPAGADLRPVNLPGYKGALTPNGAYVKPDANTLDEQDKLELKDINTQLRNIEKQTVEAAGSPDAETARALRHQRERLQAAKQLILGKYSGEAKPADPAAGIPATNGDAGTDDDAMPDEEAGQTSVPAMPTPQAAASATPHPAATTNTPPANLPKVQSQADVDAALKDANDAIRGVGAYAGKPRSRKVVMDRLREMGIQVKE